MALCFPRVVSLSVVSCEAGRPKAIRLARGVWPAHPRLLCLCYVASVSLVAAINKGAPYTSGPALVLASVDSRMSPQRIAQSSIVRRSESVWCGAVRGSIELARCVVHGSSKSGLCLKRVATFLINT